MARSELRRIREEVEGQPKALERFARSEMPKASKGSIFVGAGDSYAAALAGVLASNGACMGFDPYTIAAVPEMARGREVFFISVSGRTSSNLLAARRVRRLAKRTTSLTAVPDSKLAALTDRTVALPMTYVPKTPGMLSFSLSLLAVLRIAHMDGACDFERAFASARSDRRGFSFGGGTTYFLGNSLGFPVALYAAAKTYEFLGIRAHAELLEEFSHLELFSLKRSDSVNLFGCFDPSRMSRKLAKALAGHEYTSRQMPARGKSDLERIFHSVFASQLAVLDCAEAAGLTEPRFLSARDRLDVSDTMIY
ncbi:MAG TPA: SIS domain-containing protein [Nitrososphaerales archaeon]